MPLFRRLHGSSLSYTTQSALVIPFFSSSVFREPFFCVSTGARQYWLEFVSYISLVFMFAERTCIGMHRYFAFERAVYMQVSL